MGLLDILQVPTLMQLAERAGTPQPQTGMVNSLGNIAATAQPQAPPPQIPTGPAAAPPHPSFLQQLLRGAGEVLTGPADPRLSPAEQHMAQQAALRAAGLSMLANSGFSTVPHSLGQILAAGAQAGGAANTAQSANLYATDQDKQFQQAVQDTLQNGSLTPESAARLMSQALATGHTKEAAILAQSAGLFRQPPPTRLEKSGAVKVTPQLQKQFNLPADAVNKLYDFWVDPYTGEKKGVIGEHMPMINPYTQASQGYSEAARQEQFYWNQTKDLVDKYNTGRDLQSYLTMALSDPTNTNAVTAALDAFPRYTTGSKGLRVGVLKLAERIQSLNQQIHKDADWLLKGGNALIARSYLQQMLDVVTAHNPEIQREIQILNDHYTQNIRSLGVQNYALPPVPGTTPKAGRHY
jgi:hypothetical protein